MKAFSKKSSYLLIIMMIAALLLTGTVPSFAAKNKKTYTTPEGTVYPLEKTTILEGIPEVKGTSAIMIDGGSGRILYEKNAEEPRDPASITKIITCLLTLENMDLNDEVTITHDPVTTGQNIALKKGETLKVKDLLYALMLHSSNDAAEVLAIAVGGDFDTFAEMMNERAKECGAKNTTFHNPNGLNPDGQEHNWTTAYDISMMAREAMKNPTFRKLVTTTHHKIPATNLSKERKLKSTNPCLGIYDGITGVKTGTSKTAGFCFCGSAKRGNTELIAVSLNSGEDQRFTDVTKLLDYGFAHYESAAAALPGDAPQTLPVEHGTAAAVPLNYESPGHCLMPKGEGGTLEAVVDLPASLSAPVAAGEQVGRIKILHQGTEMCSYPITAAQNVDALSFRYCLRLLAQSLLLRN